MIELKNIYKKLGEKQVLRDLNLQIKEGETYVVIGRSGTGKSVTLKHIIGLLRPDQGQVYVMDKNVNVLTEKQFYELRKNIGMLFQNGALLNWLSVAENVALPLREHELHLKEKEIKDIVREKLALVNLHDVENLMPATLSGGMKKRVSLARAIVRTPKIILYDEPTSGLDPVMSNQINELILSLQQKLQITSICVTHDMDSAYMIANRIGMLYEGQIIAEGTPQEIQSNPNEYLQQFIQGKTIGPLTDTNGNNGNSLQ